MMFVVMKTDKKSAEKKTSTSMTNRMNAEKMMPIPKVDARINDVMPEKIVLICKKVLSPCNALCSGPRIGIDPTHNNEMQTLILHLSRREFGHDVGQDVLEINQLPNDPA